MCGSGTFLVEAALIASNVAPGLLRPRPWPLKQWHDYEPAAWAAAVDAAQGARREWGGVAIGNDVHEVGRGGVPCGVTREGAVTG
jgi:23S rRNA G2445 N2-methylase RlmL